MISAIGTNEEHWAVSQYIAGKRDRSYKKKAINLETIAGIIVPKEVFTPGGIYLGTAPALRLDNKVMDAFFEKLARGLIFKEVGDRWMDCSVRWGMVSALMKHIGHPKQFLDNVGPPLCGKDFGKETFAYLGWILPEDGRSLWVVQFYGGEEFYMYAETTGRF